MWFWLYVRATLASPIGSPLLQLIQYFRHGALNPQRLLDFISGEVRILAVLQEARLLVLANKPDKCFRVRLPIFRKAFEILEHGVEASPAEESHSVFGVLVKVGVEDALIHEIRLTLDREQEPAEI